MDKSAMKNKQINNESYIRVHINTYLLSIVLSIVYKYTFV
jgi:hypothetical protein